VICSSCGAENRGEAKFCHNCGSALAQTCPNGHPVATGARFCDQCGAAVGGAPPAQAEAPTAERRLVSILFADLVGFTAMSEKRDAEDVRDLLSRYFATAQLLVGRYGGIIEKFIGDAVMAVWGSPAAQEDDAERAVRAALDLTEAVTALGGEVGMPELRARAGVLTGQAAVTIGAKAQGMVAGDLVNTASRIQAAAEPGTVLVGEATRRASEAAIVYEDAGTRELKGKAEPVPLWRALRVIGGVRGALKGSGLEPPFVGRDRELRLVKELYHDSAGERKAHLVSVIGIAGIGKSRLSWEFFKYIDGVADLSWWHRGRCLAYGEGVTYWALAEMVRMRARIDEGEEQPSALRKLRETLERHVPDPEERSWVEPRLAHLLGLEERTARDREDLFGAWRLFFERLADENPTVMVFEDMQWADTALLDFIEHLLDWSRNHPMFVLTLARPELAERHSTWGAGKRNFTSLYLEPLSARAMQDLLSGLVPGLPEELRTKILDRAQGVPLYAVETVRMLIDRGLLIQEGNQYRPTGPIDDLAVPETLHALVAARLDGLSPEERRLVQDASVLGKTFTRAGLSALSGLEEAQLEPVLSSLIRKEVLSFQTDPRSLERGQFGFLQDLLKQVAYDTLSKKERKAKHLTVAGHLESAFSGEEEEITEVLASHYVDAYEAAPGADDAQQIRGKAREALANAGRRAASLAAAGEAQRYFERALGLTDDPLAQADLHEQAGGMAWLGGRFSDADAHHDRAIELYLGAGEHRAAARVTATRAETDLGEGRLGEALDRMQRAYDVLSREEPDEPLAVLVAQIARALYFSGEFDAALERIERALDIAESLRLMEVLSQALNTKALVLASRGRREEAEALLQHSLKIALEGDLRAAALRAYNNLGSGMEDADRFFDIVENIDAGLEMARRFGDRPWEYKLMAGVINSFVFLGRWDEALEVAARVQGDDDLAAVQAVFVEMMPLVRVAIGRGDLEEAHRLMASFSSARDSGDIQMQTAFALLEAEVLLAEGRNVEALEQADRLLGDLSLLFHRPWKTSVQVTAMSAALALGDLERVDATLSEIARTPPSDWTPSLRAQSARFQALLDAARGRHDTVPAGFETAIGVFRKQGMRFWLAITQLEHAEWLIGRERSAEAEEIISEARSIFEELKARPWLERLDRAVPVTPARAAATS
jgi:class 3 adenylate cyclase/tetratricopeptide (TPR) repeat protein